jgi:hypothetical protein
VADNVWVCPYCHQKEAMNELTFESRDILVKPAKELSVVSIECRNPLCQKTTIRATLWKRELNSDGNWRPTDQLQFWELAPGSRARPWPDYIPAHVREDYEEACKIEYLSPKASATLSRRCLQSIIRDFFGVSKPRLLDEINEVAAQVGPDIAEALHALRAIGNIGAHPHRDPAVIENVEVGEATAMIDLIEVLIEDTYLDRREREERIARAKAIVTAKMGA